MAVQAPAVPTGAPVVTLRAATPGEHALRTGALARSADPTSMTPAARLAELGEILATGARRLRHSLEGALAVERDCPTMDGAHDTNPAELPR